ncbi:MAG: hypothetical protein NTW21_00215 [Verrucomicrobia bacterium]|nr:hypothetical protein [Verrucomicrobiota bacterium]
MYWFLKYQYGQLELAGALWQHDRDVRPCHAVISNMKDVGGDGLDEIVPARIRVVTAHR